MMGLLRAAMQLIGSKKSILVIDDGSAAGNSSFSVSGGRFYFEQPRML